MAFEGFSNITRMPELRRRILFSLAIVAVYRLGIFITIPGVDREAMQKLVASQGGGLVGFFNMFSGGAVSQASIFTLGIMPYISASIIMQLLGMVSKQVEELRKEGEAGRRKIEQWTRYGTVALSLVQGIGSVIALESRNGSDVGQGELVQLVSEPGWSFRVTAVITLMTGTMLLMWLGEQVTDRGIGNGTSLIILAGIVSNIPATIIQYWAANSTDIQPLTIGMLVAVLLGAIGTVVFFEKAQRRIPIQYARRNVGRRVYGGQQTHLPLKVNMASMIPPIFASSLLMFPATLASFGVPWMDRVTSHLNRGDWLFMLLFGSLIVFFCFFYTAVTFQPVEVADNLKKQQANIPGIRPGKQTAEFIDRVLTRLTVAGAAYVAAVCIVPSLVVQSFRVPFDFGGTSLMIVVGVALETVNQIEAHVVTQSYEGLSGPKVARLSGRRPA